LLHSQQLACAAVGVGLDTARHEWEEGLRGIESERSNRTRYASLLAQVEVVSDELRRRVGQTFTLDELADAYSGAESWALAAVSEHAATPGWARDLTTVVAAAFQTYQRGAVDYEP
jgi:hypothetical protein